MTDVEWCRLICKIDGNEYRAWLEKHTDATPKQIDRLVGVTGPAKKPVRNQDYLAGWR